MNKRRTGSAGPGGVAGDRGRWSSRRKMEVVLRLLRGEDLDSLSRELGVTAAVMSQWREKFLASGQVGLRSRESDERDVEISRMRSKIGEITTSARRMRARACVLHFGDSSLSDQSSMRNGDSGNRDWPTRRFLRSWSWSKSKPMKTRVFLAGRMTGPANATYQRLPAIRLFRFGQVHLYNWSLRRAAVGLLL
jgi:transposase